MNEHSLLILGFGGHARAVADIALRCGYVNLLFYDAFARSGEAFLEHPVIDSLPSGVWTCMPATGDATTRSLQITEAESRGWTITSLISPTATLGAGSVIGEGSFVGHHAHVGPMAVVGAGCIINTAAVVEHECTIGDFSHISVNSTIAGRAKIGKYAFIGAGATIIDNITLCNNVTVGAGGVVVRDIKQPGKYIGIPAHQLMQNEHQRKSTGVDDAK